MSDGYSQARNTSAPLLIMGSPRSGTTFLAHMVNRFFDVHVCRDNGTLLRFHGMLPRYEPLSDDRNLKRLVQDLYKDYFFRKRLLERGLRLTQDELVARVRERTYGGLLDAIFSATAETHGKTYWGYKRASFARVEGRHIDALFPRARFVHIIRDARDVVLSMRTTPKVLLERSWHFAALDWASHVSTGRRLGRGLGSDRYLEIRYERLMAEPAEVLSEILRFSRGGRDDAERSARIHAEAAGLIKGNNTEKWRRLMPVPALKRVERVAGPLLAELGYPVVHPEVAGQAVSLPEQAWLHADRIVRNLFTRNIGMMVRYRVEILKARRRARSVDRDGRAVRMSAVR